MTNLNKVVTSLRSEYSRLEREMGQVGKALEALGQAGGKQLKRTKRVLSKKARQRIGDAQRLRWAKVRKEAAKLVKS
jgi:DNA anti-recombination protein RmuC